MANAPSAKKILSLLVDLLADQYGVEVTYEFEERNEMANENQNSKKQATTSASFTKCQFDV